ncbi:gamma-glutamyl-gamma-aminobutyrate hydrolase family protein [Heyndrickxia acidicola]|uniref:Gamma-glutamyl-gamma-aminobutyrate hydrolase family protein n=1 Tax=Heyndrickxia acidicola TaxID=209389 RepID=A0ABU6MH76_9BACI|nr:gamma-glutamyl-gamma-aminobutyrate hydrolase family protein [Heyndrickxia acidicola]MED1202395.1 gamma-glutamyl-gamma-aminobutyrate hydrolase family protein [Heyndrickxia acidicola]
MKPIIGITSDVDLNSKHILSNDYPQAVIQNGGVPVILPIGIDENVRQIAETIDGLLLSGGGDIDPAFFGEEPIQGLGEISPGRDSLELQLVKEMLEIDKPVLAICRGIQVLNVAAGGDMYQDIFSQASNPILQHKQKAARTHLSHSVNVVEQSILACVAGQTHFKVNSFHHQAIRKVPKPFIVTAWSSDGIIEAIESKEHKFVLGVQWHPENLAVNGDIISKRLFEQFIEASFD